jgi:hypothetical protein
MPQVGDRISEVTTSSPNTFVVESASKEVLKANENRNGCQFVNISSNAIYLGLGKTAKAEEGILIAKEGGSWNGMIGPMVWTGSVTAIASSNSTLTVVEV